MSLSILKPGILTTVQDLGRTRHRRFGINPGGSMDRTAGQLINILLGNAPTDAVLEMHFPAAEVVFLDDTAFSLGGADFAADLDGGPVENWRIHHARPGQSLRFVQMRNGSRVYLAVRGGFIVDRWLGSSSTNLKAGWGGFHGRSLRAGDKVECAASIRPEKCKTIRISSSIIPLYHDFPTLRATAGAEFEKLTAQSSESFSAAAFTIESRSDRMGYRLSGPGLHTNEPVELLSAAVSFGTVQVLPNGQLTVLMADHQTTGGYPRIAQVIESDLPLLAQLSAGCRVAFYLISQVDAEQIALAQSADLAKLAAAAKMMWQ